MKKKDYRDYKAYTSMLLYYNIIECIRNPARAQKLIKIKKKIPPDYYIMIKYSIIHRYVKNEFTSILPKFDVN